MPVEVRLADLADAAGLRRIHVLAWRDLDDVEAGGSEVHAAEVAARWAAAGIDVVLRASHAQGQLPRATRDGYRVIRRAGRYLVFPDAALQELLGRDGRADGLLEVWNGVPFFTPLWARVPRVTFIHHVHADMWRQVLPPRLAAVGEAVETRLAPRLYRRTRVLTPSPSSRQDIIERLGLDPGRVGTVPNGVDPRFTPGGERSPHPLVLTVGRLVPHKRVDALVRAVAEARARVPGLELVIVGDGYERGRVEATVADLDARPWVHLAGHVTEDALLDLYRRAWVVASASSAEGWGMTLTEGAACATPSVATRIPGHVDVVDDGRTGLLVDDLDDLGPTLARVLGDDELRNRLAAAARIRASELTWDRTAFGILEALATEARRRTGR